MSINALMEQVDALSVELQEREASSINDGARFTAGDLLSDNDVPGMWNIFTAGCGG